METAIAVAKWLLSLQHIAAAVPVMVQIGKQVFPGARYSLDQDGMPEERLYLVGELPASYRRSHKVCFRTADSERDWYIAAWFLQCAENTEYREAHPLGSHFLLAVWSMPDGWTIDKYESKPYCRVPMTVTIVGPGDADVKQPQERNENGDGHGNGHVQRP
jgi:hypothetical protein